MAIGALIYVITTIDAIPDTIPALCFMDDVVAIMTIVTSLGLLELEDINKTSSEKELQKYIGSYDTLILKVQVLISAIFHCANSDLDFSEIEKYKTEEMILYFQIKVWLKMIS